MVVKLYMAVNPPNPVAAEFFGGLYRRQAQKQGANSLLERHFGQVEAGRSDSAALGA
jgi:hypothetical protein